MKGVNTNCGGLTLWKATGYMRKQFLEHAFNSHINSGGSIMGLRDILILERGEAW